MGATSATAVPILLGIVQALWQTCGNIPVIPNRVWHFSRSRCVSVKPPVFPCTLRRPSRRAARKGRNCGHVKVRLSCGQEFNVNLPDEQPNLTKQAMQDRDPPRDLDVPLIEPVVDARQGNFSLAARLVCVNRPRYA
jgi:hypothetical protein